MCHQQKSNLQKMMRVCHVRANYLVIILQLNVCHVRANLLCYNFTIKCVCHVRANHLAIILQIVQKN